MGNFSMVCKSTFCVSVVAVVVADVVAVVVTAVAGQG